MSTTTWKKYTFEFLSIFIAVISAFALNNWNENRRDNRAESKMLTEIMNGLDKDIEDVKLNTMGHEFCIKASDYWRKVINDEAVNTDTIQGYYFNFLRDFVSIQNTSGYENLKSRGLELVRNDSLRTAIISLYEYDYQILKSMEEDYFEMQFHENYFKELNQHIAPSLQYDSTGSIVGLQQPTNINEKDKKILLSYLWKVDANRKFLLTFYTQIEEKINALKAQIVEELE